MTIDRKVDATPLCRRPLALFADAHEAWAHLIKHVLDAREAWHWALLIPAFQPVLDAGRRADLYDLARQGSPKKVPADLAAVWAAFLELVAAAVEQGTKLRWYWEESPGSEEGRYRAFARNGLLAFLDEDIVRTGFLPFKGELLVRGGQMERRYWLFYKCWEKVQHKYQRALQAGRVVEASPAFEELMRKAPDPAAWERLK